MQDESNDEKGSRPRNRGKGPGSAGSIDVRLLDWQQWREEVRHLMETFHRPEGRLMMTMGNGSTPDWKLENLEAMYEESMRFNEKLK